ncbi:MAG: hypothetical protein BGO57_09625 [Sphingomonadales bacterium 63-6]|nr:MAG: hypothetical protein BGO57_09625 [Sphingomonadales bacterium 63-6]
MKFFIGAAFWDDSDGKPQRAYEADYRARWAEQQAREAQARTDGEEGEGTSAAAPASPTPHAHKSHPAGRGWIGSGRDIGLPGEGPDAAQADFAGMAGGEAETGGRHLHTAFTPARQTRFCDRLAACGNVRMACAASGISPMTAYRARRRDPLFARVWDRALALARDHAEAVLADRALEGIAEPVFHGGEVVGYRRRYESRLLLAHLARLDRHCEMFEQEQLEEAGDAEAFDMLLARLGGLDQGEILSSRGDHVERAALDALAGDEWEEPEQEEDAEAFEEDAEDGAADWDDSQLDARIEAAAEAREHAGAQWDEAHAALCAQLDALCDAEEERAGKERAEEDREEDAVPENLPYEIKSRTALSGANGCVTGVTSPSSRRHEGHSRGLEGGPAALRPARSMACRKGMAMRSAM